MVRFFFVVVSGAGGPEGRVVFFFEAVAVFEAAVFAVVVFAGVFETVACLGPLTGSFFAEEGALTISARVARNAGGAESGVARRSGGAGIWGPDTSGVDSDLADARTRAIAARCSSQVFEKMWVPSPRATK